MKVCTVLYCTVLELDEWPDDIEIFVHLVPDQLGQDLGQGPTDRLDHLKIKAWELFIANRVTFPTIHLRENVKSWVKLGHQK
jgi:hypothetical protein